MSEKTFSDFQALGKHLGRKPLPPKRPGAKQSFEQEEKYLQARLLKARSEHNRRQENIHLNKLGTLYCNNGKFHEAIDSHQKALALKKEDNFAFAGLGLAYFGMGDYDQAIVWFDKELNPIPAMTNLCRAYRHKGDYREAIRFAGRVLDKDPGNAIAMNELGILHRLLGDYEESVAWFEKRLEIEPNNKQALDGLGITCRAMGDYEQSIRWFEKKLKHYPNNKEALDGLGITCRAMGDHDRSIHWFERLLETSPNNGHALDGLGITCREMGDYAQSIQWFEKLLKIESNNKHALDGLGITCRAMGDYDRSIHWFERLLETDPNNGHALDGLGITCREMGDYAQSIQWFEEELKRYPNDKQALDGLGITCREMGDYAQSIYWFEKKLKLHPNDPHAQHGLTATYRKMGATSQAVALLKRRMIAAPGDQAARKQLTVISEEYEQRGEIQAAKEIVDFLQAEQPATVRPRITILEQQRTRETQEGETLDQRAARLEKEMDKSQRLLQRFRQLGGLGVMVSTMAHEIAQPLQLILTTTQNCQRDIRRKNPGMSFVLEDLGDITDMAKRIDDIVTHLRELSRGRPTKREEVAVNDTLEAALKLFGEQLKAHSIRVQRELAPGLPPVLADSVQLEQVFINLIVNARDALEGRESKQITVRTATRDGEIEIGFADTGCGIPPEKLADIFDPFFTTKGEDEGTGLGLYIARETIGGFDGTIQVDSTPDQGTEFIIRLPAMDGEAQPNE